MAYAQPIYGKDLPANLGTDKVLRAIYDKIDSSTSNDKIEEKLDNIYDLLSVVINNIESNTQAIKDISINVDIHSKYLMSITNAINQLTEAIKNIKVYIDTTDLNNSIEKLSNNVEVGFNKVEDGFNKTTEAIKSLQPSPQPSPYPPCPEPEPDVIFYPVNISVPTSKYLCKFPNCNNLKHNYIIRNCKHKEHKYDAKVFVKPEQRPIYNDLHPNFNPIHTPYNPYNSEFRYRFEKKKYQPKIRYTK